MMLSTVHEMQAADARDFYSMLEILAMPGRAKIIALFGYKHEHNCKAFLGLSEAEYNAILVEENNE